MHQKDQLVQVAKERRRLYADVAAPDPFRQSAVIGHGGGAVGGAADDGESETILRCGTAAGVVAISQRAEVAAHNIVGGIDHHGIASFFHRGAVIIHAHAQRGAGGIQLG